MELKLVSFELAKILKDIGFDAICEKQYSNSKKLDYCYICMRSNSSIPTVDTSYLAPTLELAKMWFRERHKISIEVKCCCVRDINTEDYYYDIKIIDSHTVINGTTSNSYEDALEAGLLKACKLIK